MDNDALGPLLESYFLRKQFEVQMIAAALGGGGERRERMPRLPGYALLETMGLGIT